MVVPEIEFRNVAVKVPLAAVLIYPNHPTLEYGIEALNRVCTNLSAPVFSGTMSHEVVFGEVLVEVRVLASFVRHHVRAGMDVSLDDWQELRGSGYLHMKGHYLSSGRAALYQAEHGMLVAIATAFRYSLVLTDEGLIDLNDAAWAAHLGATFADSHRLAKPMRDKPTGFDSAAKGTRHLVAADTFLAAGYQIGGLQPFMQLYVRGFKDGVYRHAKLLPARIAFMDTDPSRGALQLADALSSAAMRACGTIRPYDAFQLHVGRCLIVEIRLTKNACHDLTL